MDYSPWNSPGQNTGVGSHSLLQGIFPGVKPRSPALQMDSLQAEPQGKFKWIAYPFAGRSALHRNKIRVSCIADKVFTNWAMREAHSIVTVVYNAVLYA